MRFGFIEIKFIIIFYALNREFRYEERENLQKVDFIWILQDLTHICVQFGCVRWQSDQWDPLS